MLMDEEQASTFEILVNLLSCCEVPNLIISVNSLKTSFH